MTREDIRAALSDEQALTATLLGEARGEGLEGLVAVACVVKNRADHPRWWGKSIKGCCLAPSQFSCWWEGEHANTRAVYDLAVALLTNQPLGDRSLVSELRWVAQGVIGEQLRDVTLGADHYLTRALWTSPKAPTWSRTKAPHARIASHVFFRLEI